MKISIITTTYNCEEYIQDTLESVLSQRGGFELEYIIFDACSTDSTFNIIKKYESLVNQGAFDGRNNGTEIKIFQEKDTGMYDGIAKGFKKATGDIVAYINGDDYYLPYSFSTVNDVFEQFDNVKWISGIRNAYNYKGQNVFQDNFCNFNNQLIKKGVYGKKLPFIQQESCFWRRELLDYINFEEFKCFKFAGDFYLWHTFANNNNTLYAVNSILSGFRFRPNQKSESMDKYYDEMNKIIGSNKLTLLEKRKCNCIKCLYQLNLNGKISDTKMFWNQNISGWELCEPHKKNFKILIYIIKNIIKSIKLLFAL